MEEKEEIVEKTWREVKRISLWRSFAPEWSNRKLTEQSTLLIVN
jgi:hypothetical protein